LASKNILITSGPTAVPIDPMRVITNHSTGEMGRLIAQVFAGKGHSVTLLEGRAATSRIPLHKAIILKDFFYYDELARLLSQELKRGYDIVIHAAAVSDFKLGKPFKDKLSSEKTLRLELTPTKKLVGRIKRKSRRSFLVGFKLEKTLTRAFILNKVKSLFKDAGCDLVVANTHKGHEYKACLIWPDGSMSPKVSSKEALVRILFKSIQKHI
jgi:phosphopantothenoylcysteine decarboxylase/phosphopantothenate--cysteine ligase